MSYFNRAVGGPANGHRHLLDANIDWGQDLLRLKEWADDHREARPFYTALTSHVPPEVTGIESIPVPASSGPATRAPGWYAVSIDHLMGYPSDRGGPGPAFVTFQNQTPVAKIGYSIHIFHVSD